MKLSIVIAAINDPWLNSTLESIRATAGDRVEIVLVDDCSSSRIDAPLANKVLHNRYRCGVGPSRHLGALAATGDWLLFVDAHMRFTKGWYEAFQEQYWFANDNILYCATCLGLERGRIDPENPVGEYHGADLIVYGKDSNTGQQTHIMEGVWLPKERWANDMDDILCVMGACYFIPRRWFLELSPLNHLRSWGQDEVMLSVKAWLSGGSVRHMRNVRIGHIWRVRGERPTFSVKLGHPHYNRLFAIHTLCPKPLAEFLAEKMRVEYWSRDLTEAVDMIKADWHLVEAERARNDALFVHDLPWLAMKFGIPLPG